MKRSGFIERDRTLAAVRALQKDAGRNQREISDDLGIPQATFSKLLDRLRRHGILRGTVAMIDPGELGFRSLAFFEVQVVSGRVTHVGYECAKYPEVQEVHLTGANSLLLKSYSRTNAGLSDLRTKIFCIPGVTEVNGTIAYRTIKDTRALPL